MSFTRILRWLCTVAMLSLPASAWAQTFEDGYRVDRYTTDDGLPAHEVHDLLQTPDGYLWIATNGGLVRFDGLHFDVISGTEGKINIGHVGGLAAGRGDTVWFTPEGGGVAYVTGTSSHSLRSGWWTYDLAQSSDGTLWIMDTGLLRWARDSLHRELKEGAVGYTNTDERPHIWKDNHGRVWIRELSGTVYRADHGTLTAIGQSVIPIFVGNTVTHELASVSRHDGVFEVTPPDGGPTIRIPDDGHHLPRMVDGSDRLWVTTPTDIEVYRAGASAPIARFAVDRDDHVITMLEDREGDVWAGMELTGLWRFERTPFQNLGAAQGIRVPVTSVARGRGAAMYVAGAADTGYQHTDYVIADARSAPYVPAVLSGITSTQIVVDRHGTMWTSAETDGVVLLGMRSNARSVRIPLVAIPNHILEDPYRDGVLWVSDAEGLSRVLLSSAQSTARVRRWTLGGRGRGLLVAADSTVWRTGDDSAGLGALWHLVDDSIRKYGISDSVPAPQLRGLYQDPTGTIWIGTYGAGLIRWRGGFAGRVTTRDGLADDVVSAIAADGLGNLWFAGNRGIHRASLAGLNAVLDGRAARVRGVLYGRADGMPNAEGSGGSIAVGPDGRLWFPTYGGAVAVDPALAVALDSTPPLVHILSLAADGHAERVTGIVRLPTGRRRIAIDFQGVALRRPQALTYEYRLAPLDDTWIPSGTITSASWSALGPGRYDFQVRAINTGGVSSASASLTFVVPPFFWETSWFFALVALAALSSAVLLYRLRERRHRAREAQLARLVADRTSMLASETRRAETALATVAAQADTLRTLDEAKSRFFANVSHEFRTPLSLVLGPLEDIRAGREGVMSDGVQRKLERVIANARRLVRLVEQLLDVARLESGALRLDLEVRDLVPLLRRVTESFASLAERHGIDFRLSCPVGGILARFDPNQMDKVLGNLIGNALKFTDRGGVVELIAAVDQSGSEPWVELKVRDSGMGIPAEKLEHIFERFYQVDDSPQRAHEGTGIGLAITKELLDLHGGTIAVTSEEDVGTTFTIRLPMARDDERRVERVSPPRGTPVDVLATSADDVSAPVRNAERAALDETTILVVEDNAELRDYLREHLAEAYHVIEAEDGRRGVEMAREHLPDLVISDIMMPGMDGQALCAALKGDPETDFIPVILLTARASRESRISGLMEGADDYLTKPVDIAELEVRVRNLIVSRRRLRERFGTSSGALPVLQLHPAAELDAGSAVFLERMNAVLADHLGDEDFQVDDMAHALSVSRATLYRRVEAATSKSPMDVLWQYRLQQAALWLRQTDATVSEIAYAVGFKSVPHFSRRFREQFGATPSTYREASDG